MLPKPLHVAAQPAGLVLHQLLERPLVDAEHDAQQGLRLLAERIPGLLVRLAVWIVSGDSQLSRLVLSQPVQAVPQRDERADLLSGPLSRRQQIDVGLIDRLLLKKNGRRLLWLPVETNKGFELTFV